MSADLLKQFRSLISKYKIGIFNLVPDEDWKIIRLQVKDGKNLNTKSLLAMIRFCDKNKLSFELGNTHNGSVEIYLKLNESIRVVEESTLSTITISNIAKAFAKNKKLSATIDSTETHDIFVVSVKRANVEYKQIKEVVILSAKSTNHFYVIGKDKYLNFYFDKAKEENAGISIKDEILGISYEELIDTITSNIETDKISKAVVIEEFRKILKGKTADALHDLNVNIDFIIKKLKG